MKKQSRLILSLLVTAFIPLSTYTASSSVVKAVLGFGSAGMAYHLYNQHDQLSINTVPFIALDGALSGIKTGLSIGADVAGTTWNHFKKSSNAIVPPVEQPDPSHIALMNAATATLKSLDKGSSKNFISSSSININTLLLGGIILGGGYAIYHFRETFARLLGFTEKASKQLDYLTIALNKVSNNQLRDAIDRELSQKSTINAIASALKSYTLKVKSENKETGQEEIKEEKMSSAIVRARYTELKNIRDRAPMPYRPDNDDNAVFDSEDQYTTSNKKRS